MAHFFYRRTWLFALLLLALSLGAARAQTVLREGDIAFLGYNTDPGTVNPPVADPFAFITLTNLAAGTSFNITDNGVMTTGALAANTSTITVDRTGGWHARGHRGAHRRPDSQ